MFLSRLPIWPTSRTPLTPIAAQHRRTRVDEDTRGWESAFGGELQWIANLGVLRIHEVADAGAAARLRASGFQPPEFSGWEIEWLRDEKSLPSWSRALVDAYFPAETRSSGNRARVDRTGDDSPAFSVALKSTIVTELERTQVDRSAAKPLARRLLSLDLPGYRSMLPAFAIVYLALLAPAFMHAPLVVPLLPVWLALVVLPFLRTARQRRWSNAWARLQEACTTLPSWPPGQRGVGANQVLYLDACAEAIGFADVVSYADSPKIARCYAEQSEAMSGQGLLASTAPDWLATRLDAVDGSIDGPTLERLINDFLFTVR